MQMLELTITAVHDGPDELQGQLPIVVDLVRRMKGSDRPDYWLGVTRQPVRWVVDGGEWPIMHVVVTSRHEYHGIQPGARGLMIGISYVTDSTLLLDRFLHFEKCEYVAIAMCDVHARTLIPEWTADDQRNGDSDGGSPQVGHRLAERGTSVPH